MLYKLDLTLALADIPGSLDEAIQKYITGPYTIVKRSIDARRKGSIKLIVSLHADLSEPDVARLEQQVPSWKLSPLSPDMTSTAMGTDVPSQKKIHPVIIGSGPAGLFCALQLLRAGITSTIIEQGDPVELRAEKVQTFWTKGILDQQSNVQFGEGGAGTFSDGKLNTSKNNLNIAYVLRTFHEFGAPEEILYEAKPHIGTDKLRTVVVKLREHLQAQGCMFRFNSEVTDITLKDQAVQEIVINGGETMPTPILVLAIGNSSRKLFRLLHAKGISVKPKNFAVGFRIEHPQALIDSIQYGKESGHPALPPADYKLTYTGSAHAVYSFCMCPGGVVIAASSEPDRLVTNGMSTFLRNSGMANSALVISVNERTLAEIDAPDPLKGIRFQEILEERTFTLGGGGYHAPVQRLTSFLSKKTDNSKPSCSFQPGITSADLTTLLPASMTTTLIEAVRSFDHKMKGFLTSEAILIGTETRTSSPVTILRNEQGYSPDASGLFPCGEGAGYAGGIMSAALDGIMTAQKLIASS